jgi:WD40 repeat protein
VGWLQNDKQWKVVLASSANGNGVLHSVDSTGGAKDQPAVTELRALAVAPDQKSIVFGGGDGTIQWWDADLTSIGASATTVKGSVVALAFNFENALANMLLASASSQGQVGLWTLDNVGKKIQLKKLLDNAHPSVVKDVAFAPPDGKKLASLGNNGEVKVWDVSDPTSPTSLATISVSPLANQLAWSPDGKFLVVGGSDKKAHVIEVT